MNTVKKLLNVYPEYYLIMLILLTGYTPPFSINTFAVIIAVVVILQIIFRSPVTGIIIAFIFILINLYMLVALISEFREMPAFNFSAQQLLFAGLSLILFNLFTSGIMIRKYFLKLDSQVPALS
jgi:hypothetical protein